MSNRGYEYRDVGEHIEGDPIGGVGLIDTSIEIRRYFNSKFCICNLHGLIHVIK